MRCSIELWLHFLLHSVRSILFRFKSPTYIAPGDILARELYSGHVKPGGKLNASAFRAGPSNGYGISVSRWEYARHHLFVALATAAAERRAKRNNSKVTFKGFAHFTAADLSAASTPEMRLAAEAHSTAANPFHANIEVLPDQEDDYYLDVATRILEKVQPVTCLNR